MRMRMVEPSFMCRKHLLGKHVEIHMLVGSILRGKSIRGFLDKRILEPRSILSRHAACIRACAAALALEMTKRGYKHKSELPEFFYNDNQEIFVDIDQSLEELVDRCPECLYRFLNQGNN